MDSKQVGEFAFDLQTGLGRLDVPEFPALKKLGMAASLAVHIRGLGEIKMEILQKVSDHYFDIPSYVLEPVLDILADVECIKIITEGKRIQAIIPTVPTFANLYGVVGEYASSQHLNEHEQTTLAILARLQSKPENKDRLIHELGADKSTLARCLAVGERGGLIREHRARNKSILTSPFYFADNLDALADAAAKAGSAEIVKVLEVIRRSQGWPLSMVLRDAEIGGMKLSKTQLDLIDSFASEGIIKPPSISWGTRSESFIFTPRPGRARLDASNREIYERAMALVAAVRKGQLLADAYRIRMPLRILEALRDRGFLRSNSEAPLQYQNLVALRVAVLKEVSPGRWQLHLVPTEENRQALDIAVQLLRTGELANMEVNQEARIALTKDEKYIQSIVSAAELRKRDRAAIDEQAKHEYEQLMLRFD